MDITFLILQWLFLIPLGGACYYIYFINEEVKRNLGKLEELKKPIRESGIDFPKLLNAFTSVLPLVKSMAEVYGLFPPISKGSKEDNVSSTHFAGTTPAQKTPDAPIFAVPDYKKVGDMFNAFTQAPTKGEVLKASNPKKGRVCRNELPDQKEIPEASVCCPFGDDNDAEDKLADDLDKLSDELPSYGSRSEPRAPPAPYNKFTPLCPSGPGESQVDSEKEMTAKVATYEKEHNCTLFILTDAESTSPYGANIKIPFLNTGTINMSAVQKFYDVLAKDRIKNIHIILQSSGGSVDAVECFRKAICQHNGKVTCFIPTCVEGAATLLALSCNSIVATPNTHFTSIAPQIGGFSCSDVLKFSDAASKKVITSGVTNHLPDVAELISPMCVRARMQVKSILAEICDAKLISCEQCDSIFMNADTGPNRPIDIHTVGALLNKKDRHPIVVVDDVQINAIRQFLPSAAPKSKHLYM